MAGRRVSHDLLLAAVDSPALEEGLRQAVEAGLLTTDRDTDDFRHALYQEAVYGAVAVARQRGLLPACTSLA